MASARASALKMAAISLCAVMVLSSMGQTALADCTTLCEAACNCSNGACPCIQAVSCTGTCNPASPIFDQCGGCLFTAYTLCVDQCFTGCSIS